jgi:hypothetical protein
LNKCIWQSMALISKVATFKHSALLENTAHCDNCFISEESALNSQTWQPPFSLLLIRLQAQTFTTPQISLSPSWDSTMCACGVRDMTFLIGTYG